MLVWCMLLLDMASALLDPISVARPDLLTFPSPPSAHHLPPFGIEFEGPKATNKFWANWMVEDSCGHSVVISIIHEVLLTFLLALVDFPISICQGVLARFQLFGFPTGRIQDRSTPAPGGAVHAHPSHALRATAGSWRGSKPHGVAKRPTGSGIWG